MFLLQASLDEINLAYRKLSRMFHPDKHNLSDQNTKQSAVIFFNKIKKAHDTLVDETKRALYDALGEEGLKLADDPQSMQLVTAAAARNEIKERFKYYKQIAKEAQLAKMSRPEGSITVNVNAVEIFDYLDTEKEQYFIDDDSMPLPNVSVASIDINQSITVPITNSARDLFILGGNMTSEKGYGSGQFTSNFRRMISDKSWVEIEFIIGRGPIFVIRGFRSFGQNNRIELNSFFPLKISTVGSSSFVRFNPIFELIFGRRLTKQLYGSLILKFLGRNSIGSSLVYTVGESRYQILLSRGFTSWSIKGYLTRKIEFLNAKVRLGAKLATDGYSIEYGLIKNVSDLTSISMAVIVGLPEGVSVKLRYSYGSQDFVFNVQLYDEILPSAIFYGTIVPIIAYSCVDTLIIKPYQEREKKNELEVERRHKLNKLLEMKTEAVALQKLWSQTYEKVLKEETDKNGLIINEALYGSAKRITQLLREENVDASSFSDLFDVKVPLQCQVKDSCLHLPTGSKVSTKCILQILYIERGLDL